MRIVNVTTPNSEHTCVQDIAIRIGDQTPESVALYKSCKGGPDTRSASRIRHGLLQLEYLLRGIINRQRLIRQLLLQSTANSTRAAAVFGRS